MPGSARTAAASCVMSIAAGHQAIIRSLGLTSEGERMVSVDADGKAILDEALATLRERKLIQ